METHSAIFTPALIDTMKKIKDSATVFDYITATRYTKLKSINADIIDIIELKDLPKTSSTMNDQGELAYFGAILTAKGKSIL